MCIERVCVCLYVCVCVLSVVVALIKLVMHVISGLNPYVCIECVCLCVCIVCSGGVNYIRDACTFRFDSLCVY